MRVSCVLPTNCNQTEQQKDDARQTRALPEAALARYENQNRLPRYQWTMDGGNTQCGLHLSLDYPHTPREWVLFRKKYFSICYITSWYRLFCISIFFCFCTVFLFFKFFFGWSRGSSWEMGEIPGLGRLDGRTLDGSIFWCGTDYCFCVLKFEQFWFFLNEKNGVRRSWTGRDYVFSAFPCSKCGHTGYLYGRLASGQVSSLVLGVLRMLPPLYVVEMAATCSRVNSSR